MTAPTSPYATSGDVASFFKNMINDNPDFNTNTAIPKVTIDKWIIWVSGAIDMALSEAGYVIPLQELSGEAWPVHQTTYLELVTSLGCASFVSPGSKPAPALGPGQKGSSGNIFDDLYKMELQKIRSGSLRYRAKFYLGTRAEINVNEPSAPVSNVGIDKIRVMTLADTADLFSSIHYTLVSQNYALTWDQIKDQYGL